MANGAPFQAKLLIGLGREKQNDHRRHAPGNHRRDGNTGHAHFQHKNADGVAHHIDAVHQETDLHGHLAVAHAAEYRRTRVIQGDERERKRGDVQIGKSRRHHIVIDGAKKQPHQIFGEHKAQRRRGDTKDCRHQHQLTGALPGFLPLPRPQKLACDHRAAGSQRGKQHQNHVVDHVHQRNAGNRRLAHGGNHHAVAHSHQNGQRLLDDERNNQAYQSLVGKEPLLCQRSHLFTISSASIPRKKTFFNKKMSHFFVIVDCFRAFFPTVGPDERLLNRRLRENPVLFRAAVGVAVNLPLPVFPQHV